MLTSRQSSALGANRCEACSGDLLWDHETGEGICTTCGVVRIGEWQPEPFEAAILGMRTGRGVNPAEAAGAYTVIGGSEFDGKGRRLEVGRDLRQLRRLDSMVTWDSKKRRLRSVSMQLRRISQALGMSDTIAERGFEIYKRKYGSGSPKAKSLAAVAAASLCAACRELGVARPSNELVAQHAGVNSRQLRHFYRVIVSDGPAIESLSPAGYVASISAKVGLRGTTERVALDMLTRAKGDPLMLGKRPVSLAAAALYLASVSEGDRTTQLRLAYASGVTPITIRKRAAEMSKILETQ